LEFQILKPNPNPKDYSPIPKPNPNPKNYSPIPEFRIQIGWTPPMSSRFTISIKN